jgi:5'-nucleotidase
VNVGDEFQGTAFFNYWGWEKIAETLNQMGFDAMTIGNHEFDKGDQFLAEFLSNLTFPIISANIHSQNELLNKTVKPYHIFQDKGLALIAVTTETTADISQPDDTTVFSDAVEAVQNSIDEIKATTNITRIAAITHIGYDKDQELAKATTGLQLIMGGHSHTLLGDMKGAKGKYPTIANNKDGEEVFIVQAKAWGEYLGYIDVTYDPEGKILAYHGGPIHLDNTTQQDEGLEAQVKEWAAPFAAFAAEKVGETKVDLDQTTCQTQECLLGDYIADAMLDYRKGNNSNPDFAIINAGGVRATIAKGDITRGDVDTSFPFGNAVVEIELSGEDVWNAFEGAVSRFSVVNGKEVTSFFQVSSGIKVQYNPNNANGTKLVSVQIGGEELTNSTTYKIVTVDFLATGGDNIFQETEAGATLDTLAAVLIQYIEKTSPVDIKLDGRIEQVEGKRQGNGGGNGTDAENGNGNGNGENAAAGPKATALGALALAALVSASLF